MKVLVDPEIFFYGRCGMVRYYTRLFSELERLGIELAFHYISRVAI